MSYGEKPPKSPSEILGQLDTQNAELLASMRFKLVKDYALPSETEVAITLSAGKKVNSVELSGKGLRTTFAIKNTGITEISRSSVNEDNVAAIEDGIAVDRAAALRDFFFDHPELIPE